MQQAVIQMGAIEGSSPRETSAALVARVYMVMSGDTSNELVQSWANIS